MSQLKRLRYWIIAAFVVIVGGLVALALGQIVRADRNAVAGKAALARAQTDIDAQHVHAARTDLVAALTDFQHMHQHLASMGPLAPIARITPFLRIQIRGATDFSEAGELLSTAGLHLVDAAAQVLDPKDTHLRLSAALNELQTIRAALNDGIGALDGAAAKIRALDGYRLIGPLNSARNDLKARLPRAGRRAVSARDGLDALIDMLGGSGPQRFLIFSQNPDEVRPTGGFIGTYGVLTTHDGHVSLTQFDSTSSWYGTHPQAALQPAQASLPFQLGTPPQAQTIADVNATADFSAAGQLASELWTRGGEPAVNGVISMTPAVMARIVGVLGPVTVPGYGGTITAANLIAQVDFHTHFEAPPVGGGRKDFLVALVKVVTQKALDAPASTWDPLGRAMAAGFEAREAMAWSNEPVIQTALVERAWDGTLPQVPGDFFDEAEFEYAAKNGGGLHRTFDHDVVIHADGSARITTNVTIDNTLPPNYGYDHVENLDSLSLITIYGPDGATLDATSDPPDAIAPALSGHPAASWFESAPPKGTTTFTVVWNVAHLLTSTSGSGAAYQLHFLHLPAHDGDVLHLHVTLPPGWTWTNGAPPATTTLNADMSGEWQVAR
jgi:hypothetical protein